MKVRITPRSEAVVGIAAIVVCPIVAGLAVLGGTLPTLALAGLIVMIVGVYVCLRHPLWLFWGLAAVVAHLPFGYIPGVHVPLYLLFAAGAVLAAILQPSGEIPSTPLTKAVLLLVLVSGVALIFTMSTVVDVLDYIKWAVTTLAFFALLALPREHLAKFGRIFVYASTFSALIGIATVALGSNQMLLRPFRIFDYTVENTQRFSFTDAGQTRFIRLGGLWLDPNAAGIGLLIALLIAMLVLAGRRRVVISAILLVALLLTLSRAAVGGGLLVGTVLVLLFHAMRSRDRSILIGLLTAALVTAPLVPSIRSRLLISFGEDDAGASQRAQALSEFPGRMSGHWFFGWGWGRREFKDGAYAFQQNFVSNAPLISVHRAGIFVGLVFVTMIVIACVMAFRLIRSNSLQAALYGGVVIGFSVFTLNLDHPVVVVPQVTLVYTFLLTFLVYADELRRRPPPTTSGIPEFAGVSHSAVGTHTQ